MDEGKGLLDRGSEQTEGEREGENEQTVVESLSCTRYFSHILTSVQGVQG